MAHLHDFFGGGVMLGRQERWQEELFVAGPLRDLIPEDHILKRVDKVLDLAWVREEVKACYCEDNGRPGIDPESAVRLMLAGFFEGIIRDRKLMRQAQVNLAIRWFAGYRLDEKLPNHSSLTRIRQRWGADRFRKIFEKTVELCAKRGLVNLETVHVDATLIRADVSWESLVEVHAGRVITENSEDDDPDGGGKPPKGKKVSQTDPEATMTTNRKDQRLEPSYKQHTAVEDGSGVIVDVEVTTGETNEGQQLLEQLSRVEETAGAHVETVTADGSYAHAGNYAALEERGTESVIPPRDARRGKVIPLSRFKYDAKHEVVRCPAGKRLEKQGRGHHGWWYRAKRNDCAKCPSKARCLSASAKRRSVLIVDGYDALLRARRKRRRWDGEMYEKYVRHRWRVEGTHGTAKTQHGLRRAVRRGLDNVRIQSYLTAAAMNLKCLAALLLSLLLRLRGHMHGLGPAPNLSSVPDAFSRSQIHPIEQTRQAA